MEIRDLENAGRNLILLFVAVCAVSAAIHYAPAVRAQWQPAAPAMPTEPHEPALTFDDGWNAGKRAAEERYSTLIANAFGDNCQLVALENGETYLYAVFPNKGYCLATRNSIRNDPDAQPLKRTWDCLCQAL